MQPYGRQIWETADNMRLKNNEKDKKEMWEREDERMEETRKKDEKVNCKRVNTNDKKI